MSWPYFWILKATCPAKRTMPIIADAAETPSMAMIHHCVEMWWGKQVHRPCCYWHRNASPISSTAMHAWYLNAVITFVESIYLLPFLY
ncbi:hypothetical protein AcV5_003745 [Taiwanofungus camphoratus]|nr:hypothetical protein AcV5_003745 [Antrodia cinnamomea]